MTKLIDGEFIGEIGGVYYFREKGVPTPVYTGDWEDFSAFCHDKFGDGKVVVKTEATEKMGSMETTEC